MIYLPIYRSILAKAEVCECSQQRTVKQAVDTRPLMKFEGALQSLDELAITTLFK